MNASDTIRSLATGFLPSVHGLAFPNAWEDQVLRVKIGEKPFVIALRGRCGGMAFAALDFYRAGIAGHTLAGRAMPEKRSPLARYIMRRQLESLAGGLAVNMARFVEWTLRPTGTREGTLAVMRRRELGNVLAAMVAGNPVPLGLVTADRLGGLGLNHQVAAYGAERTAESLRIRIYDPNVPGRDDVVLIVAWDGPEMIAEQVGGSRHTEWRGLFVERYAPRTPQADALEPTSS